MFRFRSLNRRQFLQRCSTGDGVGRGRHFRRLRSGPVKKPEEWVAQKAEWVLQRGYRVMKIKIGRGKWIPSWQEALEPDIAVVHAVGEVVGVKRKSRPDRTIRQPVVMVFKQR